MPKRFKKHGAGGFKFHRVRREEELKTARWQRLRRLKLKRDPVCEVCAAEGLSSRATDVHHVIARRVAPQLTYVMSNLQSLCRSCHSRLELRGAVAKKAPRA